MQWKWHHSDTELGRLSYNWFMKSSSTVYNGDWAWTEEQGPLCWWPECRREEMESNGSRDLVGPSSYPWSAMMWRCLHQQTRRPLYLHGGYFYSWPDFSRRPEVSLSCLSFVFMFVQCVWAAKYHILQPLSFFPTRRKEIVIFQRRRRWVIGQSSGNGFHLGLTACQVF